MILLLLVAGLPLQEEIARLGDPRTEARKEARRVLLTAGLRAVPRLIRALQSEDVEVRRGAARILDHHVTRSRRGRRRCPRYAIPHNNQTRSFRGAQGRRLQGVFLGHDNLMRHYGQHFRGVLNDSRWRGPLLADYVGLLDDLVKHMRGTTVPAPGRCMIEHVFAVDAIVWRMKQLPPPPHWTVRWIVRREVLPGVGLALSGRGAALSACEARNYRWLLQLLKPLCDKHADAQRRALLKRLVRQ